MNDFHMIPIEQAQQLPGVLLWHASKLWQQSLNAVLKPMNLSSTSAVILCNILHLSIEQRLIKQAEVARLSGVDLMTTSAALRTLERKGFVERSTSTEDRRINRLALTPLGERTAYKALEAIAYTHQRFFEVLATTHSVESLSENLKRVIIANRR